MVATGNRRSDLRPAQGQAPEASFLDELTFATWKRAGAPQGRVLRPDEQSRRRRKICAGRLGRKNAAGGRWRRRRQTRPEADKRDLAVAGINVNAAPPLPIQSQP